MTTTRNPDQTRSRLVQAAFKEIYENGFQGMRIEEILERTGLKKGALYHHFHSKADLAYAVIDEVIDSYLENDWIKPLQAFENPVDGLKHVIWQKADTDSVDMVVNGCPLNNLAQEMSPLDREFQKRIDRLFKKWISGFAAVLEKGKLNGTVRKDIDTEATATFLVAILEGSVSLAKASQDIKTLHQCGYGIEQFLESLRQPTN
jgi:TetR/AcrR family transcriptional repressor of nem operon